MSESLYTDMFDIALDLYHNAVGFEQEYENDFHSLERRDDAVLAWGKVHGVCAVIADTFGMDPMGVFKDVERAYTGC